MKEAAFSEEQISGVLKAAEVAGVPVKDLCRRVEGQGEATFYH